MGSLSSPREQYGEESKPDSSNVGTLATEELIPSDSITINVALKFYEKDSVLLREKRIHKNSREGHYISDPFIQTSDHDFTKKK